jgi:hypothetical protein
LQQRREPGRMSRWLCLSFGIWNILQLHGLLPIRNARRRDIVSGHRVLPWRRLCDSGLSGRLVLPRWNDDAVHMSCWLVLRCEQQHADTVPS